MKNHAASKTEHPEPPTTPAAIDALPSGGAAKPADSTEPVSESLARGILDSVVVGVVRFNKDHRVDYMNAFATQLLGPFVPQGEEDPALSIFAPFTIWPDGSVCRVEDYPASRCFATGEPQGPTTLGLHRDGEPTTWITISVVPVIDRTSGKPESVIVTFVDATQHYEIERSLRQSEDRYRGLVEQAPDAILVQRDGKVVFINDAGVKLWGGESRDALIGRQVLDFIHPRFREMVARRMEQAKSGEVTPLVNQMHVRPDGTRVLVEVTGIPCEYDGLPCAQVIMRDVTRRRRVERQVRRQRELLKKFFDRIPLVVVIFDSQGRIKMVNREWHRVLGWDSTGRISEILKSCYPDPDDRRQATAYIQGRRRDGATRAFACATAARSRFRRPCSFCPTGLAWASART